MVSLEDRFPILRDEENNKRYDLARRHIALLRPDLPTDSVEFAALVAHTVYTWKQQQRTADLNAE